MRILSPPELARLTRERRWAYLRERPRSETMAYLDWHFERQRAVEHQAAELLGPERQGELPLVPVVKERSEPCQEK